LLFYRGLISFVGVLGFNRHSQHLERRTELSHKVIDIVFRVFVIFLVLFRSSFCPYYRGFSAFDAFFSFSDSVQQGRPTLYGRVWSAGCVQQFKASRSPSQTKKNLVAHGHVKTIVISS